MSGADPCRRALSLDEEAGLFAGDALRAARHVMAGNPADETDAAYLAVYVVLAAAALGQDRPRGSRGFGSGDGLGVKP